MATDAPVACARQLGEDIVAHAILSPRDLWFCLEQRYDNVVPDQDSYLILIINSGNVLSVPGESANNFSSLKGRCDESP